MTVNSPPGRWTIEGGSLTTIENLNLNLPKSLDMANNFISGVNTIYTSGTNNLNIGSAIFISGNGNIGVGTTTPGAKLEVRVADNGGLIIENTAGTDVIWLRVENTDAGYFRLYDGTTQKIRLAADTDNFINPIGKLGIGITTPKQLLEVGSAGAASSVAISGDGHILAGTDVAGQVTISAGGSAVVQTYGTAYAVSPYVQLTPTSALIGSDWWVSSSAGSFVANVTPVGAQTIFNYFVIGSIQ